MKKVVLLAAAALLSTPVLAQQSPTGQSSGGPANQLHSTTGGPPSAATTVTGPVNDPQARNPNAGDQRNVPVTQQGSGQQSGGPANELNSSTGGRPATTTGTVTGPVNDPNARQTNTGDQRNVPAVQQSSGQQSGGPANELNRSR